MRWGSPASKWALSTTPMSLRLLPTLERTQVATLMIRRRAALRLFLPTRSGRRVHAQRAGARVRARRRPRQAAAGWRNHSRRSPRRSTRAKTEHICPRSRLAKMSSARARALASDSRVHVCTYPGQLQGEGHTTEARRSRRAAHIDSVASRRGRGRRACRRGVCEEKRSRRRADAKM